MSQFLGITVAEKILTVTVQFAEMEWGGAVNLIH